MNRRRARYRGRAQPRRVLLNFRAGSMGNGRKPPSPTLHCRARVRLDLAPDRFRRACAGPPAATASDKALSRNRFCAAIRIANARRAERLGRCASGIRHDSVASRQPALAGFQTSKLRFIYTGCRFGLNSSHDRLDSPHRWRLNAPHSKVGAVAQLGERVVRNDEVRGSIPLGSTISLHYFAGLLTRLTSGAIFVAGAHPAPVALQCRPRFVLKRRRGRTPHDPLARSTGHVADSRARRELHPHRLLLQAPHFPSHFHGRHAIARDA